jgi:hypothetical protein
MRTTPPQKKDGTVYKHTLINAKLSDKVARNAAEWKPKVLKLIS